MRCYTVTESRVTSGIAVITSPYPHVGVGEEGRGRVYVRVPLGRQFAATICDKIIDRASVLRTRERGTLLVVEERDPTDRRALVLVDIAAGYRGSTEWTGPGYVDGPCPNRGRSGVAYWGECPLCGIRLDAGEVHPDEGTCRTYDSFPPPGITVLAEGYRAQGDAGRMGGHNVRLLIMEPGSSFRVYRIGRVYGAPRERIVMWTGDELRLGTRDEIWPPTDEPSEAIVL